MVTKYNLFLLHTIIKNEKKILMKFYKKIIFIFLINLNFTNVFTGLLPETMVFMGNGTYKRARDLKIGDYIPVYNLPNHCLERQRRKVVEIFTKQTKKLILIQTSNETLIVGGGHRLYNRGIKKFIRAKEFKVGDMLFSPEKGNRTITNISREILQDRVTLYDIALEESNLFLILTPEKTHILVHNEPITVTFLTGAAVFELGKFVIGAAVSTLVGIGAAKSLSHFFRKNKRKNNPTQAGNRNNPDLDDILRDATAVKKPNGKSDVYEKNKGKEQREKDFDKLNKGSVREIKTEKGTIKFGVTQNGETIVDRNFSSERSGDKPTLEIQRGEDDFVKIRYND